MQKIRCLVCVLSGVEKSRPLEASRDTKVINDRVGVIQIVLTGDESSRAVRAYRSGDRQFKQKDSDLTHILYDSQSWGSPKSDYWVCKEKIWPVYQAPPGLLVCLEW